jgi:hypothetical protein
VALVALAFRPAPEAKSDASSLEGAWKTVQVHAELQDTTWTRGEDRPNLTVFADGHWAALRVAGDGARAELPEDPTDEQLLEAWRPFRASGGTYSVSGSTLSTTTTIAKSPNAMGNEGSSTFTLDGDKLVRVFTNEENGNTWTVTYKRAD